MCKSAKVEVSINNCFKNHKLELIGSSAVNPCTMLDEEKAPHAVRVNPQK